MSSKETVRRDEVRKLATSFIWEDDVEIMNVLNTLLIKTEALSDYQKTMEITALLTPFTHGVKNHSDDMGEHLQQLLFNIDPFPAVAILTDQIPAGKLNSTLKALEKFS